MRKSKAPKHPLDYHKNHPTEICTTDKINGAYYRCVKCNKWIAWLSKKDVETAIELGLIPEPQK